MTRLLRVFRDAAYGADPQRFVATLSQGRATQLGSRVDVAKVVITQRGDRIRVEVVGDADVVGGPLGLRRREASLKPPPPVVGREKAGLTTLYYRDGASRDSIARRLRITRLEVDEILDEPWPAAS